MPNADNRKPFSNVGLCLHFMASKLIEKNNFIKVSECVVTALKARMIREWNVEATVDVIKYEGG